MPRHGGGDQVRAIARATFDGFLQSDLMPQGMQAPALIWAAAFLVGPALFFPAQYMAKYPFLRMFHPKQVERALWDDRLLFLLMSAGAMGLVAVVLWQTLFPARRDAFVLTPLPVPDSIQMLGRLGGLMALCGLFVVALNGIPAFSFPFVASPSFAAMPRWMAAHFVSATAFDLFVFFSVTSLQGLVILVLGRRAADRLASVVQTASVLVLLLALLFIGLIQQVTARAILAGDAGRWTLAWFPPSWFLGLYEFGAGTPRHVMTALATRAALAAIIPTALTAGIYALGYRRLLVRALETPPRPRQWSWVRWGSRLLRATVIRRPEEQAIAGFMLRAIARSARHSMLMSIYVGAGLALMVTYVLPSLLRSGPASLALPSVMTLSLPLVLAAALAVGGRIVMTIPAEMPARWLFQTAGIMPRHADAAAHKALLLIVVPPVALTAMGSAGLLWGPRLGALHAVYCGALAVLLCEFLLLRYRGLPLTRPYAPGGARVHLLWAVYLSGFLTYTLGFAEIEGALLSEVGARGVLTAALVVVAVAFSLWVARRRKARAWTDIPFEAEEPDDVMFQGFNLSEIHAAQAIAAKDRPR